MSKIHIENYKGHDIEYDLNADKFICDISIEDQSKSAKRKNLLAVRKDVDLFIKANLEFKPFKVLTKDLITCNVEAIRTDGLFVVKGGSWFDSGHKSSKNMEDSYRKYDPEIEKAYKNSLSHTEQIINEARNRHEKLVKQLKTQLKPLDISQYIV